jgi:hypothetical protein
MQVRDATFEDCDAIGAGMKAVVDEGRWLATEAATELEPDHGAPLLNCINLTSCWVVKLMQFDHSAARAAATACSAVSAGITPGPPAMPSRPFSSQLRRATTSWPMTRAKPISERVPPLAADRDHRLAGGDDGEVAGVADAGGDDVGAVLVGVVR